MIFSKILINFSRKKDLFQVKFYSYLYLAGNEGYGGGGGFGQNYENSYGGGPMKQSSYGNQRAQPYGGGGGEDSSYSKFPPITAHSFV